MSLIDDRGRLFGKVNLIDAIVGFVVLGLIPLAYGALLLFRVPPPTIVSIDPKEVVEHQLLTLRITGKNLRPFLHARIGNAPGKAFLVQSTTQAELQLPDLAAGTFDVVLLDEGQELFTLPTALTVKAIPPAPSAPPPLPPPPPPPGVRIDVQAVGAFVGLAKDDVRLIGMGLKFQPKDDPAAHKGRAKDPPVAEVLALRAPEPGVQRVKLGPNVEQTIPRPGEMRVPAIVRLNCLVVNGECKVGDTVVALAATVTLPLSLPPSKTPSAPPRPEQLKFLIEEVRPVDAPAVFAPPALRVDVQVVGVFVGLVREDAQAIVVGSKIEPRKDDASADAASAKATGEVLALRPPEAEVTQLRLGRDFGLIAPVPNEVWMPGIIRLNCVVLKEECMVGETIVAVGRTIALPLSLPPSTAKSGRPRPDQVRFVIEEVRTAEAPAVFPMVRTAVAIVRVRFAAEAELLEQIKAGDVDLGDSTVTQATGVGVQEPAVLVEITDRQPMTATTVTDALARSYSFQRAVVGFTGTLRIPVVFSPTGWSYHLRLVKVGARFAFETVAGAIGGLIVDMKIEQDTQRLRTLHVQARPR